MATSSDVPSSIRQLAHELAEPQPMRRGSLSERTIKCGKAGCACAADPDARHGPYYSLTRAVEGKTQSRFLSAEQAALAQQQIAAGREFRQNVDAYWEACEAWADAQLMRRAASSGKEDKKGGSQRNSRPTSSRKSRRS
jgi:Family of unknown function (DUF6788)